MTRPTLRQMFLIALMITLACRPAAAQDKYTLHEWGTFTVLQDEQGNSVPGVNVNEESLPNFVFRLAKAPVADAHRVPESPFVSLISKNLPIALPAATMRLETPVIYLYPPRSADVPSLDIRVRFRGGWVSEWYPDAEVDAPGYMAKVSSKWSPLTDLSPSTVGQIEWTGVKSTTEAIHQPPSTDEHVWAAPRKVSAPRIITPKGNVEHYLFYRGIANLEAPLRVVRDDSERQLTISANEIPDGFPRSLPFNTAWLVDVRRDGTIAFRSLSLTPAERGEGNVLATTPSEFPEDAYSIGHLAGLQASMRSVLVAEGLFEDEADAMLNTWELSYFKSPGLRLFFALPRIWTDHVLPLEASQPADVERVMVGRIELISPWQRKLLQTIANGPTSEPKWYWEHLPTIPSEQYASAAADVRERPETLDQYGFRVPADYQAFIDLGRFREALVRDGLGRNESPALRQFVASYGIVPNLKVATAPADSGGE